MIMPQTLTTSLGSKGYTLLKNELTGEQQDWIRKELTVKPYTHGAPTANLTTFPAYRESGNKIYVPRFFGEQHFGPVKQIKIPEGDDIDVTFQGALRDYQVPVVDKYLSRILNEKGQEKGNGGLLELPCGFGKCLGKDTLILMYDGTFKMVQDIQVGDLIMGDDSTPRTILSLARGREQMYRISSKRGDSYICNESHILSLKCSTNYSKQLQKGTIVDISVDEYLDLPDSFHGRGGVLYGYKVPIEFPYKEVDMDPYLFGFWLGDGTSKKPNITTQEGCIIKYIVDLFKYTYKDFYLRHISKYDYRMCSLTKENRFMTFLRTHKLLNNKHIPYIYKCNSRDIRLKVLAGLIDSDGYNKGNCYEIIQKNSLLAADIVYLCRSLGFASYTKKCKKTCTNSFKKEGEYNRICIYGSKLEEIPVLCPRKKATVRKLIKSALSYRIQIEKLKVDKYYGFEIDGNHRFVLGDFSVTHNTSISLHILSQLKKKTIVIVHKEFLMNQWIERIQQFLPTARIGKIQGQTIDIENKDIVLAMLQSLSMKEYPSSLFDSFGFTIIDEVHHISSETFSRALYKFVTKYSLGLSATMNRKDGTTKTFKMFLGEVVHKTESKGEREVEVRCINYKTNDDEFNETILDYRGQPQNSSMISKLCSYNRRTEFIIQTLTDFICTDVHEYARFKKEMDQQIPACKMCLKSDNYLVKNTCCNTVQYCLLCMNHIVSNVESKKRPKCPHCAKVLVFEQNYIENPYVKPVEQTHTIVMAHNLNVLEYIYTKFVCKNLASVGYYVGGMKEHELKASEKKQVILASYSMCSEGLDIPTLTTEFLISPKTDVVQIVGRILRAKHATAYPIIYDFVDSHDVFQRQWLKRKAYYKKQNYRIIGTNNHLYTIDTKKWTKISEGTCVDDDLDEEEAVSNKDVVGKCLLSTFKKG